MTVILVLITVYFLDGQLDDTVPTNTSPESENLNPAKLKELQIKISRGDFVNSQIGSDLNDELLELLKEVTVTTAENTYSNEICKSPEHVDSSLDKEKARKILEMLKEESFDDLTESDESER